MTESSAGKRIDKRFQLIESVKTPLAFFVLTLLVVEALLATLVVKASGADRTIAIVGMLALLFAIGAAVFLLAYRRPDSLSGTAVERVGPKTLDFDQVIAEIASTIDRLEQDAQLVLFYRERGDFPRLMDGLYSALLYASSAVPTGKMDAIFYGNLMEWEEARAALRVRYFKGPYNDEIITRAFPLKGPKQGVASAAVESGQIHIRNSMESELKERGEARLRAMMSVPVPRDQRERLDNGAIVAVNIDSVIENAFPPRDSSQFGPVQKRALELGAYIQRVNRLRMAAGRPTASQPRAKKVGKDQ
jgi:hypothetical protein